uniref:Uncharacterized protein n=1 Tax=Rhizophagus irregularis (strain DAOM 181602 / DAOM 197198 / MUCL 43194) TaxID=747089 RepID=U9T6T5_RHIID
MAQFLANELLIIAFKELLNLTRWKNLIELVLTEEIEFRKISVHFKYENREEYLVEFNLERNSNEMMEVKYSIEWNYKDYLLDEKLNTKDYQYKYIIKRPTFDIDDFVCDFSHFTLEL